MRYLQRFQYQACSIGLPVTASAFADFYEQTSGILSAYCASILHDPDAVEDAVQLTYLQLWAMLSSETVTGPDCRHPFVKFVKLLPCRNGNSVDRLEVRLCKLADLHIDRLRKRYAVHLRRHTDLQEALEIPEQVPSITSSIAARQLEELLSAYIQRIDGPHADLLRMYFLEDRTQMQIARQCNVNRSAITKRLNKAIEELRLIVPHTARHEMLDQSVLSALSSIPALPDW